MKDKLKEANNFRKKLGMPLLTEQEYLEHTSSFGYLISSSRIAVDTTLSEMSKELGKGPAYWNSLENRRRHITKEDVELLKGFFAKRGLILDDIQERADKANSEPLRELSFDNNFCCQSGGG